MKAYKAINDFANHHSSKNDEPVAVHWTIKQLLDTAHQLPFCPGSPERHVLDCVGSGDISAAKGAELLQSLSRGDDVELPFYTIDHTRDGVGEEKK